MGVCNCSMYCCTLLYVHSSIAITLMGKRELIALLNLSSWCLVMVERLFLTVPRGCLQFVIVVFPDHTHLLFSIFKGVFRKINILVAMKIFWGMFLGVATNFDSFSVGIISIFSCFKVFLMRYDKRLNILWGMPDMVDITADTGTKRV